MQNGASSSAALLSVHPFIVPTPHVPSPLPHPLPRGTLLPTLDHRTLALMPRLSLLSPSPRSRSPSHVQSPTFLASVPNCCPHLPSHLHAHSASALNSSHYLPITGQRLPPAHALSRRGHAFPISRMFLPFTSCFRILHPASLFRDNRVYIKRNNI